MAGGASGTGFMTLLELAFYAIVAIAVMSFVVAVVDLLRWRGHLL